MAERVATWTVTLDTVCPSCEEYVDLLNADDFWEGKFFELCEHTTERSRDVKVNCPECGAKFTVDLEF